MMRETLKKRNIKYEKIKSNKKNFFKLLERTETKNFFKKKEDF